MRAVTYARVSTDQQAEKGFSLPEQEGALRAYCDRKGYVVLEHVTDDLTGKIAERPGILRIRELIAARVVDVVVLVKLDRLSRSAWKSQQLLESFRDSGTAVEFIEHTSGERPADRLLLNVLGGVSEFEHALIRERTMKGREQKARSGRVPGLMRCLGYDVVSTAQAKALPEFAGRDGEILVNEPEAEIVRRIFSLVAEGKPLRQVCQELNGRGIRTKQGNMWETTGLGFLLRNTIYVGRLAYGKSICKQKETLTPSGRPSRTRTLRPREEWLEIASPPIIDPELFARVQVRLDAIQAPKGRPSTLWVLRGTVFCGLCTGKAGNPMACGGTRATRSVARPGYAYRYYRCGTAERLGVEFCGTSYSADRLEALAYDVLQRNLEPGRLGALARAYAQQQEASAGDVEGKVRDLERQLAGLDGEENRIADLLLQGISPGIVRDRLDTLHQRQADLRERLDEAHRLSLVLEAPQAAEVRAEEIAEQARRRLEAAGDDPALLQSLYQLLLRITLKKGEQPLVQVRTVGIGPIR